MSKNQQQIDDMIREELITLGMAITNCERQLDYYRKRYEKLDKAARECDHEVTMKNTLYDHCRKCEFDWVR